MPDPLSVTADGFPRQPDRKILATPEIHCVAYVPRKAAREDFLVIDGRINDSGLRIFGPLQRARRVGKRLVNVPGLRDAEGLVAAGKISRAAQATSVMAAKLMGSALTSMPRWSFLSLIRTFSPAVFVTPGIAEYRITK